MKKISQYLLAFLFVALIFELVVISPSDVKETMGGFDAKTDGVGNTMVESDKNVNQSMANIHVVEARNETKEWELWADSALGLKAEGDFLIQSVKINFFTERGVSFDVTGDRGSVKTDSKNITVDGSVVTKSSNGYVFKTPRVEYNSHDRVLLGDAPVVVTGPRQRGQQSLNLSGENMSADLERGIVRIDQNVRAKKMVDSERQMAVSADTVHISSHTKEIRFTGNVVIHFDGMDIKGPDALFNYNEGSHELNSIDLTGGVNVRDLSKSATSDRLNINLVKNEYVFDGKPRLVQDNDELTGDRIVFLDGGKRVKIQNAKINVSKDSLESKKKGSDL